MNKKEYPIIKNQKGMTIYTAPKKYIQLLKEFQKNINIKTTNIRNNEIIYEIVHNYQYASEPLISLDSTFQILGATNERIIYISLTNINS